MSILQPDRDRQADLRTDEERSNGYELTDEEYAERDASRYYDALRNGDRGTGGKERGIFEEMPEKDGFNIGNGFAQGEPMQTMTGDELKSVAEGFSEKFREQQQEVLKQIDAARSAGASPEELEGLKAEFQSVTRSALDAEAVGGSITPDMAGASISVEQFTENIKENLQKLSNAVNNYRDANPSHGADFHMKHDGPDR